MTTPRTATIERTTSETDIRLTLTLEGSGQSSISTGLPFFDHMLTALTRHSLIDLSLTCTGDLHIDDHHTIEDCAIALGSAFNQALDDRAHIHRFASTYAPLDESLVRCVIDLSGRPAPHINLPFTRPTIGPIATENIAHFFTSFAISARCALHLDLIRGTNDHHRAEAAFKACALALRCAIAIDPRSPGIPSTKGSL
ncbi:MAG: imidazoleglycerol-phosphate dehydratase HisB [Phycisphaeraceae bacterium]|nr:imidazoleglycerol-phosphate dehydratase HisB [Phycisphaeraceae bacterium]MCW5763967.1 imidazoleglycerol-phosphate dehydratase HisB [Phycisphaeraceae bacterium]